MAKIPAKTPKYEDESLYEVVLARPITIGGVTINPTDGLQLKGKHVEANEADIIEAVKA